MCGVRGGRGQDQLGVGGDLDLTRGPAAIDQRDPAHFAVVFP